MYPKQLISARKLSNKLKQTANNHEINISDFDFLMYNYHVSSVNVGLLAANKCPFIFTSQHAVESILNLLQNNQLQLNTTDCFAISGKTATLAKASGFKILDEADDASTLAHKIIASNTVDVMHCTTSIKLKTLSTILKTKKINLIEVDVYQKTINPVKITTPFDGVMFFSPSQIDSFLIHNNLPSQMPAFCIGSTTANYLRINHHTNCIVADFSSAESVLQAAITYYLNLESNH